MESKTASKKKKRLTVKKRLSSTAKQFSKLRVFYSLSRQAKLTFICEERGLTRLTFRFPFPPSGPRIGARSRGCFPRNQRLFLRFSFSFAFSRGARREMESDRSCGAAAAFQCKRRHTLGFCTSRYVRLFYIILYVIHL